MIKKSLTKLFVLFLCFSALSCSTAVEKVKPYWLQIADEHLFKGVMLHDRQEYSAAIVQFTQAIKAFQRFDYVTGLAQSNLNLAKTEITLHHVPKAMLYLQQLQILINEHSLSSMQVHLDIMKVSLNIQADDVASAIVLLNEYVGELGENKRNVTINVYMALLTNRVRAAIKINVDSVKWVKLYESHLVFNDSKQARLFRFKAQLESNSNNLEKLNQLFTSALNLYRKQANPRAVLSTLKEWGHALLVNKDFKHAAKRYESAYKVALSADNVTEIKIVLNTLITVYESLDDDDNKQKVLSRLHKL